MKSRKALPFTLLALALVGCGSAPEPPPSAAAAGAERATPDLMPQPFTAEEIRDAWRAGLTVTLRNTTPEGEAFQRWTVVAWDEDGLDIEAVPIDAAGTEVGAAQVEHSTWGQLRDHASFPAAAGTRERVTRDTPLGTLDGWLYTVHDAEAGTVTEFFFATSLPGAPVEMRITREGALVAELQQVAREQPEE